MDGPYADLMWSDPDDIEMWANNMRGAGFLFGSKVKFFMGEKGK